MKKIKNSIVLELSNNLSIELKVLSAELATMNNHQVSLGVFALTPKEVSQLKNNRISKIIFQEIDDRYQIISTNNTLIVARQLNCFK